MPTVATRLFVAICWLLAALRAQHDPAERTSQPSPAATTTPSDDPAYDALLARLAERPGDVAKAIARVASPAARARLQAAFGPAELRPMAMLAVARLFPDDPEADSSLLAAAAALVANEGRGDAVPELALWNAELSEHVSTYSRAQASLLPTLLAVHREIAARRARGGDPAVLDHATELLGIASVSRGVASTVWLCSDARFATPSDLREPIELSWYRREFPTHSRVVSSMAVDPLRWHELLDLGAPIQRSLLEPQRAAHTATILPGHYLLAVRSLSTPWWGVLPIEVSDLEVLAAIDKQALVLATWGTDHPIAASFELTGRTAKQGGAVDGDGSVVPFEPAVAGCTTAFQLEVRSEAGPARLHGSSGWPNEREAYDGWRLHTVVDRPVYQPGETVRGRLVLRRCRHEGVGRAAVPSTTAANASDVRVLVGFGDAGTVTLVGRTDERGLLPFEFEIPETAAPTNGIAIQVEVPERDDDGKPLQLAGGAPFAIAHFERAATTLACTGPEFLPEPGADDVVACTAQVRYASGAPVAGQLVQAQFEEHTTTLCTGPDGNATLRVAMADWQAWWLRTRAKPGVMQPTGLTVQFKTVGPDGSPQVATHTVRRSGAQPDAVPQWPRSRSYDEPRIDLEPSVVGQPTRIVVHGPPGARALLVVGRSVHARALPLQFDEHGRAVRTVRVQRADWPRLDVALLDRDTLVTDRADVTLGEVVPVLVEAPATATPGSEIACRVRSGRPGALVTLAVVDERLFAIEADRTCEPTAALRPATPAADWQRMVRARRVEPGDALAGLLENGKLPPLDGQSFPPTYPGAGGPGMGLRGGEAPMRADFRSVAHFATQVADAEGDATFPVHLPSDLTTWRLTVVVVDGNGEGGITKAATATRLPWSVEPVLPRAVREGDSFELPLVIARDAEAKEPAAPLSLELAATSGTALLEVGRPPAALVVPSGASRSLAVPMRSLGSGLGQLDLALRADTVLDRSQRSLPIARDVVARPLVAAQRGTGTVRVPLPEGASADEPMLVDVMLGDATVWSRLERDLAVYPYGCAEQTLSKLLPYFAAVRASVRRKAELPAMDQAFRRRLRAGLGRLRQLRTGEQFAFWPGGAADPEISVLVKHGLAVLREAGVDLAAEGLDVAGTFAVPASLPNAAGEADRTAFVLAIERAAATLRLAPDPVRAQQLAAVTVPDPAEGPVPQLPLGTTARLGLALLASGADAAARACLLRLDQPAPAARGFVPGAGDDPLAVQAMRLELRLALDDDRAAIDRGIVDLVVECAAQRGSTYGQGCAAAALALAMPPASLGAAGVDVVVEASGERSTLHLDGRNADLGRIRLPHSGEVVVHGPDGATLLVRLTSARTLRGSSHPAWRAPLTVERSLHTVPALSDAASLDPMRRRRANDELPLATGPLPAGQPILLVVRTSSPTPIRHVVVECPLPCGFEVLQAPPGVERFPEHVAFVADLPADQTVEWRLLLMPTTVGRFAWPPTTAQPMYAAGLDGGSAGAIVEVVASPRRTEPSIADWQAPPTVGADRVVPPWQPANATADAPSTEAGAGGSDERDATPLDVLRRCWQEVDDAPVDLPDLTLATARALGFDPETADPWHALAALDDWLVSARRCPPERDTADEAREARFRSWLADLLLEAFDRAIATNLPEEAGMAAAQVHTAEDALVHVEDADQRMFRRISLLRRAATGAPETVAMVLAATPEDPDLADAWPGYRELLHLALVHQDPDARRGALDRLSVERQEMLPVAVLLHARGEDWDEEFVQRLVRSERQGPEFLVALHDADLVFAQRDLLRELLPDAWWPQLPLRVYERLADVTWPDARSDWWSVPQLAAFVARGPCRDDELRQAFARTDDDGFRAVLAHALRRRGVRDLGERTRPADVSFAAWSAAVALAADDLDGAATLLRSYCDADSEMPSQEPAASIAHFLRWLVVERGAPQQVYAVVHALDEATWARVWERMTSDERVPLVDLFQRRIPDSFLPRSATEAEAIWRFLLRGGDLDAMVPLTQTTAGVRCARQHVEASDGGALAAELREAFADALDLDVDTLQAPVEDEGTVLLEAQRRSGHEADLTARGRAWLERLRRQLGATRPVR